MLALVLAVTMFRSIDLDLDLDFDLGLDDESFTMSFVTSCALLTLTSHSLHSSCSGKF